jgi:glycosyltransferase involved in cell wall biosynthesis
MPNGVERALFAKINNGVLPVKLDKLRSRWRIQESHRVIVYIGSMSLVSHAVDLLFKALSIVLEQNPNVLLVMVGAGEDFMTLQHLAKHMNLSEHIRFVGKVPMNEVVSYYSLAELSVDPRSRSIPAESSLSLKLLESIAAGIPCVTADIGDRQEVLDGAGLAIPPDDEERLADGILHILEHPELALTMRQAAKALRENIWWDKRVDLLINQFSSLLPR